MSSRKPQRAPRGVQKSEVINFRIRPSTKALLKRAAEEHGRTVSAECEYQLQRALVEMGTGPTHALLAVVGSAVDRLIRRKTAPPDRWARDPRQFDSVVEAITSALRLFRPEGPEAPRPDCRTELGKSQGRAAVFELLVEIAAADPFAPFGRQSPEQRRLGVLKQDLGELIGRPALERLIGLTAKAANNPDDAEENDARELWKLMGTVVKMKAVGLTIGSPEIGKPRLTIASQPSQAKKTETGGGDNEQR
jgi:hypothetical protein